MYYAIYKNVRDSAWRCLRDFKVDRLPVNLLAIAEKANIRVISNTDAGYLLPHELGKALTDGSEWIIIYDDTQQVDVCRLVVAHELGHIFLGHNLTHAKYVNIREIDKKPKAEQQADAFALRLLCPACVLHALDLQSAEEIAATCKVPLNVAKLRADRMRELNKRNKFFTSPLEREIYENFQKYLSK